MLFGGSFKERMMGLPPLSLTCDCSCRLTFVPVQVTLNVSEPDDHLLSP